MRMVTDKIYYGDYKFIVELDTGAETGANQLTVWAAEKVDIDTVSLSQFSADQLLKALIEPLQSRLRAQLAEEKRECQRPFEAEIAELQGPFQTTKEKKGKQLPGKVKRKVRNLREQMKIAVRQLEADFLRRELRTLDRHYFARAILQAESRVFGEERTLRDFYFEEANDHHIRNFCRRFALDSAYRQEVLAGEIRWVKRNALFERNLFAVLSEDPCLSHERDYDRKAYDLFHWIDVHVEEILALPEYQRLKQIDSAFQPCSDEIDPFIRPAVEALNRIPGVTTQFSCQGVSGKVPFQGRDLLVVSPHVEFAYVSFSALGQLAHDTIVALLPAFPSITPSRTFGRLALYSTGDNLRFREETAMLAHHVLDSVDESWKDLPEGNTNLNGKFTAHSVPLPQNTSAPGGILPSRLAWLCQPEQLERTLHLLFHLNHWAKAREHLLYADRQGLYQVKAAVLQQAYTVGAVTPTVYVDGSQVFACDYSFELAAGIATEVFLDRLDRLFTDENTVADDDAFDKAARHLFTCIAGYEAKTLADVEALDVQQVEIAIHAYLQALVTQARSTRQPIASSELSALFIEPADLLDIYWSRSRPSPTWDELDEGEARKIDPEGLSLIAFQYDSPIAHYIFHLPFRIAESFLPEPLVNELKNRPGNSRECGSFYGRTITEAESPEHPIEEILRELIVDVAAICPYGLIKKREYLPQLVNRYPYWDTDEEDEYEDEDENWDDADWEILPKRKNHGHTNQQTGCPLCGSVVDPAGSPRVVHWQQTHHGYDLTISHVAWVSGKSKADLKSSTSAIPPDYRGPSSDGHGTRFWKLETLEATVKHIESLHFETNEVAEHAE